MSLLRLRLPCALALLLVTVVPLGGCLTPSAPIEVETPRKFAATSKLRNLVVLPFKGPRPAETRQDLEDMLRNTDVQGDPFFQLTDPRKLQNVRHELQRIEGGKASARDLSRLREQTGAQGIFSGRIIQASVEDTGVDESRAQCEEKENTWRGVVLGRCQEGMLQEIETPCTRRRVHFSFEPRLISVETGRLVFVDRYTRSRTEIHCEGDRGSLTAANKILEDLTELVMEDIQEDITPEIHVEKVPMKKLPKKSEATEEQRESFESALEFAKAGRLDRSCQTWHALSRSGLADYQLHYNLAICREQAGDLNGTLQKLLETDKMLTRPDEQLNLYLRRIRSRIEQRDEMERTYRELMAGPTGRSTSRATGSSRSTLAAVQKRLGKLGYDCGTPDGQMGPKTQTCIRQYQSRHGLRETGNVTKELVSQLRGRGKKTAPANIAR